MNRFALGKTLTTGKVHFFSRSRAKLWKKGETSGNELEVRSMFLDCDQDVVRVKAKPRGPACHTGRPSCFFRVIKNGPIQDWQAPAGPFSGRLRQW